MSKKEFALQQEPVDYVLSVHMRNLFATYGEEQVKAAFKLLFSLKSEDHIAVYDGKMVVFKPVESDPTAPELSEIEEARLMKERGYI